MKMSASTRSLEMSAERDRGRLETSAKCEEVDRGQTTEICEKQEKYLKGKVVTFTVKSLILCQYPVDLLTFLELY